MSAHADAAVAMFSRGFNCAQSVLACCGGPLGLPREVAMRVAGPFGAGMGRMCETCGAVTGAFMVIGLKYAKTDADNAPRDKGYQLVNEFTARFKQRNKSICCRELLGCDMRTPEGMEQARKAFGTICPKLVRDAAEIVEELLENAGE